MPSRFASFVSIFFLCFAGFNADNNLNSEVEQYYTRAENDGYQIGGYKKKVEVMKGAVGNTAGDDWISRGYFVNKVNRTGFGYLELETNRNVNSAVQAYHAGFLEGFLTSDLIYGRWFNTVNALCREEPDACQLVIKFVKRNSRWASKMLKKFPPRDPFWYQVRLFYLQVYGVLNGYNSNTRFAKLDWDDILFLNILTELEDVLKMAGGATKSHKFDNDRCSALIKIMPGNSDIYFGHNAWNHYTDMLRILKKYNLNYATSSSDPTIVPGHEFSASSYPAAVLSVDDYYLIASSGLAVMETTNEVYNTSLFKGFDPHGMVWESIRTMVANRLAVDGKTWHETFKKYNSGTYNNQWMVLDYNKFVTGKKLGPNLLWVGEQLPHLYQFEDVTDILESNGYWASYNIPYFKNIFEKSGYGEELSKNGSWFSHSEAPRAKIFARDQGNVKDMESFMKLMRSNNYKNDPYAFCNCTPPYSAAGAIAARKDLNPAEGEGPQIRKPYGAIDAKITNYSMFKRYTFTAVAGPTRGTNDELPVFKWSESPFGKETPRMLQPDVFNFTPVSTEWVLGDNSIPQGLDENNKNGMFWNPVDFNKWHIFNGDDNNIPID